MFEKSLVAARTRSEVGRAIGVLPLALGIHALAFGVVLAAQLWAVPPVPEPYTVVSIYHPPQVPVPAGSAAEGGKRQERDRPARHSAAPVQPSAVPDEPAKPGPPEVPSGPEPIPGTIPGTGGADGPGKGDGRGGPGGGADVAPEPEVIHVVGGRVIAPEAIFHPAPAYPEAARRMRLQGTVIVQATIDTSGNVVDARALRGLGFGCEDAALEAIRTWRYRPATLDGRPVSVYLTVTVTFQLRGGE